MIDLNKIFLLVKEVSNKKILMTSSALFFISALGTALEVISTHYFGELVDSLAGGGARTALLVILVSCWLGAGFLPILYQYIDSKLGPYISRVSSEALLKNRMDRYPWNSDIGAAKTAEFVNTASDNIYKIHNVVFFDFVRIVTLISISIFLLSEVNILIPVVLILWSFLYLSISYKLTSKVATYSSEAVGARAEKQSFVTDVYTHIREIFLRQVITQEILGLSKKCRNEESKKVAHRLFLSKLNVFQTAFRLGFIVFVASVSYLGVSSGKVGVSEFAMSLQLSILFASQVQDFSNRMYFGSGELGSVSLCLNRLDFSSSTKPENEDSCAVKLNRDAGIEVVDLSLKFGDKVVFDNFSLKIDPGMKVLLSGDSGSGKSSLLKLLTGELLPDKGSVKIFGSKVSEIPRSQLSKIFSFALQEVKLLGRSLRENIVFHENSVKSEDIENLLEVLSLTETVKNLPDGLDTPSKGLLHASGGERQRIMLMRSLLKKDFDVLFLDEISSSLHRSVSERILRYVFQAYKEKTIIVISHREKNGVDFDQIVRIGKTDAGLK